MRVKYYKMNLETNEVHEEYIEMEENMIILPSNPIMENEQKTQDEEIANTQEAVNYLLMTMTDSPSILKTTRGCSEFNLGKYLGNQILKNRLDYQEVIEKYSEFKLEIDAIINNNKNA